MRKFLFNFFLGNKWRFAAISAFFVLLSTSTFIFLNHQQKPSEHFSFEREVKIIDLEKFSPELGLRAEVVKKNIITLTAPKAGVVDELHVNVGEDVRRGQRLLRLSDTYTGKSVADIQARGAGEIRKLQAQITDKTQKNIDVLRERISRTDSDSNTVQRRELSIQKRLTRLQFAQTRTQSELAALSAELARPSAPFDGRVEEISVRRGQSVSAGTPLLVLKGKQPATELILRLDRGAAKYVDLVEPIKVQVDGREYPVFPAYLTTEAVNGVFQMTIVLSDSELSSRLSDGEFVDVKVPLVSYDDEGARAVPLGALRLDDEAKLFFLDERGVVKAATVELEQILGSTVFARIPAQVRQVIADRFVVEGEKLSLEP